jgi:hypothetical protein
MIAGHAASPTTTGGELDLSTASGGFYDSYHDLRRVLVSPRIAGLREHNAVCCRI